MSLLAYLVDTASFVSDKVYHSNCVNDKEITRQYTFHILSLFASQ